MAKARTAAVEQAEEIVYATLAELQSEKPLEDDIKIRDRWYRIRGMKMHEINVIIESVEAYKDIPALQLAKDEAYTIMYGLMTPSFSTSTTADIVASLLMIEQWPKDITQPLAQAIRRLTWPQYTEEEPEPLEVSDTE